MSYKNIILSILIGFAVLIAFGIFAHYKIYNSKIYQIHMMANGNAKQKIKAADFAKLNNLQEAVPYLIDNIIEQKSYVFGDNLRTVPCASVSALIEITGEDHNYQDPCKEINFENNFTLRYIKNHWYNWYFNKQYPDWQFYKSDKFGFEIKYPKEALGFGEDCKSGDGMVPIKVFEYEDGVYISYEYIFKKINGECKKINNSLDMLQDEQSWNIIVRNIKDDEELDNFVNDYYSNQGNCRLGEKKMTSQEGAYNVYTYWDGRDLGTSDCYINYVSIIKYFPEKGIVVAWDDGQEPYFWGDEKGNITFDEEMINSFKFIY